LKELKKVVKEKRESKHSIVKKLVLPSGDLSPIFEVNIFAAYLRLWLGKMRYTMLDGCPIQPINQVYYKEWVIALNKAKKYLKRVIESNKEIEELQAYYLIVKYNEGLFCQGQGIFDSAYKIFKDIVSKNKYYIDAYLRLATIWMISRRRSRAIEYAKLAEKYNIDRKNNWEPTLMLGNIYYQLKDYNKAYDWYKRVKKHYPEDTYSLVALGNLIYFKSTKKNEEPDKQQEMFKEALSYYMQAIEKDDTNVWAAIGMGNISWELGFIEQGLEIFGQLKDINPQNPNCMINYAHWNMMIGNLDNALNIYKKTLSKYYDNKNFPLEWWIANLHFIKKDFYSWIECLKSLMFKYPSNLMLKYNLGVCLHVSSQHTFTKADPSVHEVQSAIAHLQTCHSLLTSLKKQPLYKFSCSPPNLESLWSSRLIYVESDLLNSPELLRRAVENEKARLEMRLEKERQVEEYLRKERERKEAEKREKEEEERDRQERLGKMMVEVLGGRKVEEGKKRRRLVGGSKGDRGIKEEVVEGIKEKIINEVKEEREDSQEKLWEGKVRNDHAGEVQIEKIQKSWESGSSYKKDSKEEGEVDVERRVETNVDENLAEEVQSPAVEKIMDLQMDDESKMNRYINKELVVKTEKVQQEDEDSDSEGDCLLNNISL
jgi:RNA polymerase-associated protein CTR9